MPGEHVQFAPRVRAFGPEGIPFLLVFHGALDGRCRTAGRGRVARFQPMGLQARIRHPVSVFSLREEERRANRKAVRLALCFWLVRLPDALRFRGLGVQGLPLQGGGCFERPAERLAAVGHANADDVLVRRRVVHAVRGGVPSRRDAEHPGRRGAR